MSAKSFLWQCAVPNFAVWGTAYGLAYYFIYCKYKDAFAAYKFNPKYPKQSVVRKEIILSAVGVAICSVYEAIILSRKYSRWSSLDKYFVLNAMAIVLWVDAHFYFYHRFLHWVPFLYKRVHSVHHESVNVDPFSGLSFHPLESAIYFSSLFIVLGLDIPSWAFQLYKYGVMLAPLNGHSGHGNTLNGKIPMDAVLNSFEHYIHHALFHYNYGSGLLPIWDRVFGTDYKVPQDEHFKKVQMLSG